MTIFDLSLTFEDIRGRKLTQAVSLGDFTTGTPGGDYTAADSAATQLVDDLRAICDARITSKLSSIHDDGGATVAGGDSTENAVLNLYLDNVGSKLAQFYVKAPSQAIFAAASGPNYDNVDVSNAALISFVNQLSQHAFISDGEQVDTTITNGIESGKRITKKYTP